VHDYNKTIIFVAVEEYKEGSPISENTGEVGKPFKLKCFGANTGVTPSDLRNLNMLHYGWITKERNQPFLSLDLDGGRITIDPVDGE